MTKGTRTALFVAAASLANILVTLAIFLACLGIYSVSLGRILPSSAVMWAVVVSFVIGMAGAFLIYKKVLAIAQKKYNLDEKLGLGPRRPRD